MFQKNPFYQKDIVVDKQMSTQKDVQYHELPRKSR